MAEAELIQGMKNHLAHLGPAQDLHIELGRKQYVVIVTGVDAYPRAYIGSLTRRKRGTSFDSYPDRVGLEDSFLNKLSTAVLRQLVFKEPQTAPGTQALLMHLESLYTGAEDYTYGASPLIRYLLQRGQAAHGEFQALITQRRARHHLHLRAQMRPGRFWMHRTHRTLYTVVCLKGKDVELENEKGFRAVWTRIELIRDFAPLAPRTTVCANTTSPTPIQV